MNEPSIWAALSDPNFRSIILLAFTASAAMTMIFAILTEITTPVWDGDFLGRYSNGDDHGQP